MKIILNNMDDITCFVTGSEFYDGRVEVTQKHYRVNGRSLMGMCSLDTTKPVDVTITTTDKEIERDFYNFIQKWSVKND